MSTRVSSDVTILHTHTARVVRGLAKPFSLEPLVAAITVNETEKIYKLSITAYLPDGLEKPVLDEDISFIAPIDTDANELDARYVYLTIEPWDIGAHHSYSLWNIEVKYQLGATSPEAQAVLVLYDYEEGVPGGPETPETPRGTVTTVKRSTTAED
ncbi:hypothetical protein [Chitinophaga sp. GbtcB8]|uniref:hypothetical protein n=1 Tax=Chitinophaga sp. GbtcB8 TaxID=2824753 RepID=UPI001C2F8523|nr:hypothetical protein [Chitinophaga sp. GbtcB8]